MCLHKEREYTKLIVKINNDMHNLICVKWIQVITDSTAYLGGVYNRSIRQSKLSTLTMRNKQRVNKLNQLYSCFVTLCRPSTNVSAMLPV